MNAGPSLESGRWHTLGVRLMERGQLRLAGGCFRKAVEADDTYMKAHFNLGQALLRGSGDKEGAEVCFRRVLELLPTQADARINLSGLLLTSGRLSEALEVIEDGLQLCAPSDSQYLYVQLNTILRRMGRTREAIERTWAVIERRGGQSCLRPAAPLEPTTTSTATSEPVVFVMVKWGSKYGAEYVRRLAWGIRRQLQASGHQEGTHYRLMCLTDDPDLIHQESSLGMTCVKLPDGLPLTGWWVKAYLFSPDFPVQSGCRMAYIDLDTVVTGHLQPLCEYRGPFATLSTSGMASEMREGGFNTSVMLWPAGPRYEFIYTRLVELRQHVSAVIQKFDHWCEMVLLTGEESQDCARCIQEVLPGVVSDYKTVHLTAEGEDAYPTASLVTFPLQPKPHECQDRWVLQCWVEQKEKADSSSLITPKQD